MTPQEATNRIVSIKRHLIQPQLWSRLQIQDMQYALDEAIKALEKQIPKTEFCDMGQGWSCPTCGALTGRHFVYCPECGQRLE